MDGQIDPTGRACEVAIGRWTFDSAAQTLTCGADTVRLEQRAARLLELFISRCGEVVEREEILAAIWGGRELSANSLAVVISDLRRALGDDARAPRYIETVPKRGYRLSNAAMTAEATAVPAAACARRRRWTGPAAALGLAAVALLAAGWLTLRSPAGSAAPAPVVITINNVTNQSGDSGLDVLAASISEIGTAYLARAGAPVLIRDRWDFAAEDPSRGLFEDFGEQARVQHISSTLVLEDGRPRLVMFANNPRTDEIVWSWDGELVDGEAGPAVRAALADFLAHTGLAVAD